MSSELTSLPSVTSDDDGKVLFVKDGAWEKGYANAGIYVIRVEDWDALKLFDSDAPEGAGAPILIVPGDALLHLSAIVGPNDDGQDVLSILSVKAIGYYYKSPSSVISPYYTFSEENVPCYKAMSYDGPFLLVPEEYEDKLVQGTGEHLSGGLL